MERLKIANEFGSVDVRGGLAKQYVHVPGKRLQPLCRRLKIKYADALVGFSKRRHQWKAILDGVVVSARSAERLRAAIDERTRRNTLTPEQITKRRQQQERRRAKRQAADVERFAADIVEQFPRIDPDEAREIASHACVIGSRRVGRTTMIDEYDAVRLAVVAHVRHAHTDYDLLLAQGEDRDLARDLVRSQVAGVLADWEAES